MINGFGLHEFAVESAGRHSELMMIDFHDQLRRRFGDVRGDELWNFLIKDNRDVAFCIDTSASMKLELEGEVGIKADVIARVQEMAASGEVPRLTLVTFDDDVQVVGTTCSPSEFAGWVDALVASGGGDCGEYSSTALFQALARVGRGGSVFLVTDEPPWETPNFQRIVRLFARSKEIAVSVLLTGDCPEPPGQAGAYDEQGEHGPTPAGGTGTTAAGFRETAVATGGLFTDYPLSQSATQAFVWSTAPERYEFLVHEGTGVGNPVTLNLPIDSGVTEVDFKATSLAGGFFNLHVYRPNGALVLSTDSDVIYSSTTPFRIVGIAAPTPGTWQMVVTGTGVFAATAGGTTDLGLVDLTFFRNVGPDDRPGEEPITGSLAINEPVGVRASMFGTTTNLAFDLVLPDGTPLSALSLSEVIPSVYYGDFTPTAPVSRFLVKATGVDGSGLPFQRMLRRSFGVSTLKVRPPGGQIKRAGCPGVYAFEITNDGSPDLFDLSAMSSQEFAIALETSQITLGTGESATVDVTFNVPTGTDDTVDTLMLTVVSTTDPSVANAATVETVVECLSDCNHNCLYDAAELELAEAPDANDNGIPDTCEVLFVDSTAGGGHYGLSWAEPYSDLPSAIAVAGDLAPCVPNVEVWVKEGTYTPGPPGADRSATFLIPGGVSIYGGFAGGEVSRDQRNAETNPTILSGDLNGNGSTSDCCAPHGYPGCSDPACQAAVCASLSSCCTGAWTTSCASRAEAVCGALCALNDDNSYHVVSLTDPGGLVVLDGFTVTGGFDDALSPNHLGAGALVSGGQALLKHCRFQGNVAYRNGLNPYGGGGVAVLDGTATLFDCAFVENAASTGGGLYAGATGAAPSVVTLLNCRFLRNAASYRGGGMAVHNAATAVMNGEIHGNWGHSGGGGVLHAFNSSLQIVNSTIAHNSVTLQGFTPGRGGGIWQSSGPLAVANSILWGNRDAASGVVLSDQIYRSSGPAITVDYSIVEEWTPDGALITGIGTMDADPLFVDADGDDGIVGTPDDDLGLQNDSPAIDAAGNAAVLPDDADLDGDANTSEPTPIDFAGDVRFVDTARADTGSGVPPLVDIGAYEAQCSSNADCDDRILCTVDECTHTACRHALVRYGDVNEDGFVNVNDALCALDYFAGIPHPFTCPNASVGALDVVPCPDTADPGQFGDGFVNVGDVLGILDAFAGLPSVCSLACPG